MTEPLVGIIMGSKSDWETMRHAADLLDQLGIPHETRVVSAHRTPKRLYDYAHSAKGRGLKLVIAGAGGAAHLPGMTASMTELPVLGVPIETQALKGMDSLLSIVQMPAGVPVGTLAIGRAGAVNAGLLAASMTTLPVLGVPVETQSLKGMDSLLSIVQMPAGVPVGTLAIGKAGAANAALFAASILAIGDPALAERLEKYRVEQTASVAETPE